MIPLRALLTDELPRPTATTSVSKTPSSRAPSHIRPIRELENIDESNFRSGLESSGATPRLGTQIHRINIESNRVLRNEADVVRLAYEHLTHPVSLAFPQLDQVSEQVEASTRVDTMWKLGDEVATVLEFKRYGMVKPEKWSVDIGSDAREQRLGQQIRMYAGEHKCPQMVLFDYGTMVIFRLPGSTKNEILATNAVEGFVVNEEVRNGDESQLTMRQALFLIIQEGYERIMERRRREGVWNELRDENGRTCFRLGAIGGSPATTTYWREVVQGNQRGFQNMRDGSVQGNPPADGLYFPHRG